MVEKGLATVGSRKKMKRNPKKARVGRGHEPNGKSRFTLRI
jgi:hypothetical protein